MTKEQLTASIKATNNGYIFAPTTAEILAAKANPDAFEIHIRAGAFTQYIYLRKA